MDKDDILNSLQDQLNEIQEKINTIQDTEPIEEIQGELVDDEIETLDEDELEDTAGGAGATVYNYGYSKTGVGAWFNLTRVCKRYA